MLYLIVISYAPNNNIHWNWVMHIFRVSRYHKRLVMQRLSGNAVLAFGMVVVVCVTLVYLHHSPNFKNGVFSSPSKSMWIFSLCVRFASLLDSLSRWMCSILLCAKASSFHVCSSSLAYASMDSCFSEALCLLFICLLNSIGWFELLSNQDIQYLTNALPFLLLPYSQSRL